MQDGQGRHGSLSFPEGWQADGMRRVSVSVRTKDFMQAVGLIEKIAEAAEEMEHHPDIHLTGYNDLRIESWSHDKGGLTERDAKLAERIDAIFVDVGVKKA